MKRRIEILPIALVFLAVAGISLGYQEVRNAATEDVSKIFNQNCSVSGCHRGLYPPMGLSLEMDRFPNSLINVTSRQISRLKLVDTQNTAQSYLFFL